MSIDNIAIAGTKWLWEKYGKDLVDKMALGIKQSWEKVNWTDAESKYRTRLFEQHSTAKLLGRPKPLSIAELFTDVFVLDKMTAFTYYDLNELQSRHLEREKLRLNLNRRNALEVILDEKLLYILGKPGSGKTTLLKHIALQACVGKINKTPIFISLQEWANSELELFAYIVQQFDICGFPNAELFVKSILTRGMAILLLDALDEVNQKQRNEIIREIKQFTQRYPEIHVCLTCRIAAVDIDFDQFVYLEIAEFDEIQIEKFIHRWYEDKKAIRAKMLFELAKDENTGLRELAQTPLLLALLCLVFEEIGFFPNRRVDLYKEAADALLKKWDASRGVERDSIYHDLSLISKKQLLMHIAHKYFEKGVYFISEDELIREINVYFSKLSNYNPETLDGEIVLRALESQHGFLVKRGRGIYSFLHLTFQEYFTALYMIENISSDSMANLLKKRLNDKRWDEIVLMATSLLQTK